MSLVRTGAQHGFSLLEILVAFSILALSLGVMMQIYSGSLRNVEVAADTGRALALAQSILASAGVEEPFSAGELSGESPPRFRWKLVTNRTEGDGESLDGSRAKVVGALELWEVTVEVSWVDSPTSRLPPRSISLTSLRLKSPVIQ